MPLLAVLSPLGRHGFTEHGLIGKALGLGPRDCRSDSCCSDYMKNKRKQMASHVRRKFWERFGIKFTRETERGIKKAISTNKARFIERQSNRISVFEVEIEGTAAKVIYDKVRHCVVTAWPLNSVFNY